MNDTVVIHPSASVHESVKIGPFTVIGPDVTIGEGTVIDSHVVIHQSTSIGAHNRIGSYASLGSDPQHTEYHGHPSRLEVGDHNVFREFVTVNRAYEEGSATVIGSHNYFMCQAHIAHDCVVGDHVVFANAAAIAGYVEVANHAFLSPFTGVHQHCRIGEYAFLGRATKVGKDILPYMLVTGVPGSLHSVNLVGLKRQGFTTQALREFKKVHQLFSKELIPLKEFEDYLTARLPEVPELDLIVKALDKTRRGIAR